MHGVRKYPCAKQSSQKMHINDKANDFHQIHL